VRKQNSHAEYSAEALEAYMRDSTAKENNLRSTGYNRSKLRYMARMTSRLVVCILTGFMTLANLNRSPLVNPAQWPTYAAGPSKNGDVISLGDHSSTSICEIRISIMRQISSRC
jgi:hypothetical protein